MQRKRFIKLGGLSLVVLAGYKALHAAPPGKNWSIPTDQALLSKLIAANDKAVAEIMAQPAPSTKAFSRKVGIHLSKLAAAWVSPASQYHQSEVLHQRMLYTTQVLLQAQSADGTVSIGNLESPPDTAFLLESLTTTAFLLRNHAQASEINDHLKSFLQKSGEGLVTGGVHTPNHRWVIAAALARLYRLFPKPQYRRRIDQWLVEGIFIDKDGHYPERSVIYSNVENNAFITLARLLGRKKLLEPVKKNLTMMYYYMEPNGDMVTTDSRRQDQYMVEKLPNYYLPYRFMANYFGDSFFAGIAKLVEGQPDFTETVLPDALPHFLEDEWLQQTLPAGKPPPANFERLFTTSSLLRIRRNDTTATLFGGTDKPIIIASGRSNSPNIFSYRKGQAILEYLRLSTSFFSTGYFYSNGITSQASGYLLQGKITAPYYQPMPKSKQKPDGDYALTPSTDGRFWNKMDFANRPVSNVKTLETKVLFQEKNGHCKLHFNITGQSGVQVTIELCFREGGQLEGAFTEQGANYILQKEMATYTMGHSQITFGPGFMEHSNLKNLEGERYSTHFGTLRTSGMHVYITGITPFTHTLEFY